MLRLRQLRSRLQALWHRSRTESELDEEIRFHLSEETERRIAAGKAPDEARREARAEFGNVSTIREAMRDAWGLSWVDVSARDVLRSALRNVVRSPRTSIAAVVCIALAMAATSAAITLVTATMWRPLPFRDADRLVRVWLEEPGGESRIALSYPELVELGERVQSLDLLEATARARIQFRSDRGSRRVEGEAVSAGYFEQLGIEPLVGRLFTAEEHRGLGNRVMLLSHATWGAAYAFDPEIVGTHIVTDSGTVELVGVLPASFTGTVEDDSGDIEFWVPMYHYLDAAERERRDRRLVWTMARLTPDVSLDAARAELETFSAELARLFPDSYQGRAFTAEPFGENWRSSIRQGSFLLLTAAILVLVVASANVALLLLARAIETRRRWAMRLALGAGRLDVVRLAAAEAALVVAAGSALGLLVGPPLLRAFLNGPSLTDGSIIGVPVFVRFTVDPTVAALCGLFFMMVAIIAALGPALHCMKLDVNRVLQDTSRGTSSRRGRRWFRAIVLTEVALTTVLAIGATLLVRTYSGLIHQELGFRTEGVLRIGLFVNEADVADDDGLPSFRARVREAVLAEPGVTTVGMIWPTVPIDWAIPVTLTAPGLELGPSERSHRVDFFVVDRYAFQALDMPIVAGRGFATTDSAPVGIVNRALAHRLVGEDDPERAVGLEASADGRGFRIIGVVENARLGGPKQAPGSRDQLFLPFSHVPRRMTTLLIAGEREPESLVAPIRERLAALAPASALDWIGPLDGLVHDLFLRDTRFVLSVLGAFAVIGLVMSAAGLFAVLADSVARRRGEIGLRQALGASPKRVLSSVLGEALTVVLAGIALGAGLAFVSRRALASMLFGVSPTDPWSHAGALLIMLSVATAAAAIPALRAAAIDPADALRDD